MKFTEKETQKYNGITPQDLIDFKNRKIIYNSTQSSCLGCENAVLTLENEVIFYNEKNKFLERLNNSDKIKNYSEDRKHQLFFRWVQQFLVDNHKINKGINYIYTKTKLNELKEASILIFEDSINELS